MQPRIAIISGVRTGGVVSLPPGEFVIGRDSQAHLALADETISQRHCVIAIVHNAAACHIEDCGSINGTTLNGETISGTRPLRHGDRIGVGSAELVFLIETDDTRPNSPVLLDASPMDPDAITVSIEENPLHETMVEVGRVLRYYRRDIPLMREKLLLFLFTRIPAKRAAILLRTPDGASIETLGHDVDHPAKPIRVNLATAERVYKEGKAVMSPSVLCVPMQGFDRRFGVVYAESSGEFTAAHFELLSIIARVSTGALEHATRVARVEAENSRLKRDLAIRHDLVGDSAAMVELGRQIAKAAPTDSTVLIQGESGTGKELVARAVHRNSKRAAGPFVAINCGAISETLLESELFGHEKGAFTGAAAQKKGKFEIASGGTLFLDEVGELPAAIQVKLLRVLQEREIDRLGGTKPIKVDIRLIAATNRDLEAAVSKNEFRQDLYFRLKVITIRTPPLRERPEDILLLARHFISQHSRRAGRSVREISPAAEGMLKSYRWPGNIRELQNVIESAIVLGSSDTLLPEDFPEEFLESESPASDKGRFNLQEAALAAKRETVEKAYAEAKGNWKEVAALLDINPTHVYALVKKLGLGHLLKSR